MVEDCVNAVGVDLNTASAPLLARVAGMTKTLAQNIVEYRDENGRFESRRELKKVPRLGPKAFEQCAGFMRIAGGKNPLDASGVHPEAYPVVEKILQATAQSIQDLMVIRVWFVSLMRNNLLMNNSVYQRFKIFLKNWKNRVVIHEASSKLLYLLKGWKKSRI